MVEEAFPRDMILEQTLEALACWLDKQRNSFLEAGLLWGLSLVSLNFSCIWGAAAAEKAGEVGEGCR